MLKHILTGQPATASSSSRHQNAEFTSANGTAASIHQHQHQHIHPDHLQLHHHHHHQQQRTTAGARGGSADVYDSIGVTSSSSHRAQSAVHNQTVTTTPSSSRHPLNHSQLSVNNLSQRLNHSHVLGLSTQLSTSKHSVDSASPVVGNVSSLHMHSHINPPQGSVERSEIGDRPKVNGGLEIARLSKLPSHAATPSPAPGHGSTAAQISGIGLVGPSIVPLNTSLTSSFSHQNCRQQETAGVKEMLSSLGLLCLVSLLLALLSLIFLLKISHLSAEEYAIVYEVTLALCALALSLNMCCLLVCAIQFLFAVKLVKSSYQGNWTNAYLQNSSISRVCAVGGFFISIPVFLTGMILYTFIQFQSTPAIVMSVFIGLGIIFCGCAMVHNVFVWQREKTNAVRAFAREQCEAAAQLQRQQKQQQQQLQQQQQQQHHQQNQLLGKQQHQHHNQNHQHHQRAATNQSIHNTGNRGQKMTAFPQTHSTATLPSIGRGQHYHPHNHHHGSVPVSVTLNNLHQSIGSYRNATTPPTPGDFSPPSPSHKHNRSHILSREVSGSVSPGLPQATLDLSSAATTNSPHELSTLV